jgi:endonuclease G
VTSALADTCTAEQKAEADKRLWLNKRDKQLALERHLPGGAPQTGSNESLFIHRDYVINYSSTLLVPIWTAHRLDARGLGKIDRIDCFRQDPRINSPLASLPSDYSEPIFDQGHLSPNGDMSRGLYPVLNSFPMSNMTPQYCQFNRGVWQILESMVRLWAKERKTVHVITGSVFDRDGDGQRDADADAKRMKSNNGKTRVAVPSHMYKIIVDRRGSTAESLAILLPHDQTDVDGTQAQQFLEEHVRPIADIEAVTGIRFNITANEATSLWPITGTPARSLVSAVCRKTDGHSF